MDIEATDGHEAASEETAVVETAEDSAQVEDQQAEATNADDDDGGDDTANSEEGKKPARGVQKRLDELTRRYHEERRDKERLMSLLERGLPVPEGQQAKPQAPQGPPQESDFADYDEYQAAMIDWRVEQKLVERQQHQTAQQRAQSFQDRVTKASSEMPDYAEVVFNPSLPITPLMMDVIMDSDIGEQVAYHLGKNPTEASRIANLPPHRQAAELGRIEVALTQPKPAPATPRTPPPAPPKTVSGVSAGLTKAPEDMSMAEYVAWRANGG